MRGYYEVFLDNPCLWFAMVIVGSVVRTIANFSISRVIFIGFELILLWLLWKISKKIGGWIFWVSLVFCIAIAISIEGFIFG